MTAKQPPSQIASKLSKCAKDVLLSAGADRIGATPKFMETPTTRAGWVELVSFDLIGPGGGLTGLGATVRAIVSDDIPF